MKNLILGLMVVMILGYLLSDACAGQFEIRPYTSVRGEYNDNIFYDPDEEEDDYILSIRSGITLTQRTERLDARLSGQITPFFYQDNSRLDDVDQDYRGRINYQFTPRFFGGADAFFIKDHRPDRDVLATGVVQDTDRRNRYHVGGSLGYTLSELTSAGLTYDYNWDDWSQRSNRRDVETNAVTLGLNHNLSRWLRETSGRFTLDYRNIDRDTSEVDSFAGTIGVRYRISELYRLRLRGGGPLCIL